VESRADGDAADPPVERVEVPALEPERPKPLPKALPPAIVPATHPVNPAPFLAPPVEPAITSPVKGAILPTKKPLPASPHDAFDEIPGARYGHDRWGVPVSRREEQTAHHFAARRSGALELSRPGLGITVGLVVGLATASVYCVLAWALGVEYLYVSLVIGLATGWATFRSWGRQGVWVGIVATVITALSFALAVVVVTAMSASAQYSGDVWTWLEYMVDHPARWWQARLDSRPLTVPFLVATALAAFLTAAGPGRKRVKVVPYVG